MKLSGLAYADSRFPTRGSVPSTQRFLYHGTRGEFKDAILRQGLLENPPDKMWYDSHEGVYLTESPRQSVKWSLLAFENMAEYHPEKLPPKITIVQFQVAVSGLDRSKFEHDTIGTTLDWVYHGNVPPEAITLLREDNITARIQARMGRS